MWQSLVLLLQSRILVSVHSFKRYYGAFVTCSALCLEAERARETMALHGKGSYSVMRASFIMAFMLVDVKMSWFQRRSDIGIKFQGRWHLSKILSSRIFINKVAWLCLFEGSNVWCPGKRERGQSWDTPSQKKEQVEKWSTWSEDWHSIVTPERSS